MLATVADAMPAGAGWIYEPKYDGIRVLAAVDATDVALVTRNGHDRTRQFPEVRAALASLGARRAAAGHGPLVLDGEIVARPDGAASPRPELARFEALQPRINLDGAGPAAARLASAAPALFVAFDCLMEASDVLVALSWRDRRGRLEGALAGLTRDERRVLRCSTVADGREEGRALLARLRDVGAEGMMAKCADAPYAPGRRSRQWRKLKLEHRQELVVGGYTEPRAGSLARDGVGALLLGYFDDHGALRFAGRVGTGFGRAAARHLAAALATHERPDPPFADPASSLRSGAGRERAALHWVDPVLVAEVRFSEWTAAGRLRQPVFLGLRDDKPAGAVRRERRSLPAHRPRPTPARRAPTAAAAPPPPLAAQIRRVIEGGGSGVLQIPIAPRGPAVALAVTNLGKPLLPTLAGDAAVTKGDLMAYYAAMAPVLLPAIADRPLVLERFPNGLGSPAFHQQHAPAAVPAGVRVEVVVDRPAGRGVDRRAGGGAGVRRFVGGDLPTLLHLVQLGAVSVDPWHGRLARGGDASLADYAIIDLDPGPATPFDRVVRVARLVKRELDALGLRSIPKTSGASGLHVVVPLASGTPADAARLLAEFVARRVAGRHPAEATVERSVARRPADAVYVDFLQNVRGKTVAAVYSARARPGGTVSTPLRWREVGARLDPAAFTIATVPRRVARVGDLWAEAFGAPNDLAALRPLPPARAPRGSPASRLPRSSRGVRRGPS